MIGRAERERAAGRAPFDREVVREACERDDALTKAPRALGPLGLVGEDPLVILRHRDRARRRWRDELVGLHALECGDHLFCHRPCVLAIAAVHVRQAAATAALDDVHVRAQGLERARGRVAGAREEVVDDARGEEADADDRIGRVRLRDLTCSVVQRLLRHRGEALLLAEVTERQAHQAAVTQRALERRQPARHAIDALRRGPLRQRDAFGPRDTGALDSERANVGDERRDRDAHRAHRVARVAADTHLLLVRDAVEAVMERRHHESDRAGVDVAEHVPADHLVGGTDVAARAALDAPQRLAERWVFAHGGAAVVDEHEMQLLRTMDTDLRLELDVRGARRSGDELRVRTDLLSGRAPREELQHRCGVVERRNDLLHADHSDVHRGKARREVGVALVRDEDQRAGVRDEDVATGDANVRLEERGAKLIARDRHE